MGSLLMALVCFAFLGFILAIVIPIALKNEKKIDDARHNRWLSLDKYNISTSSSSSSAHYAYPPGPISMAQILLIVDEENQAVYVSTSPYLDFDRLPFSEIIGYETIIDDRVMDAVGRSVIGGILAGETGAIIGAMTAKKETLSYKLVIYRDNIQSPQLVITLIENRSESKNYQDAMNFASRIQATLKVIIHRNQFSGG